MKRTNGPRHAVLLLALVLALALIPRARAAETYAFTEQPTDIYVEESWTATLHWSAGFVPADDNVYWITGGNLQAGTSIRVCTAFYYDTGSALEFAKNLPEMNVIVDDTWISETPYRIIMRPVSGTKVVSDPFYIKPAPHAFVYQPQTVYVPAGGTAPISWTVNYTPDANDTVEVYALKGSNNIELFTEDVKTFFKDRAGNPPVTRRTMEVMADESMIRETPYRIGYEQADGTTLVSEPFYIYPATMPQFVQAPRDVLIVDGEDAPFTWSIDKDPMPHTDNWGYTGKVYYFTGGNVYSGVRFSVQDMLSRLGGSWVTAPGEYREMSVMASSGWVSDKPYTMIIYQDGCPELDSEPFYVRAAHTVKFVQNEYGWSIPDQVVIDGECVQEPVFGATISGYTFGGWYKDASFTQRWDFSAPVTEAMTLYAKWNINYYRVEYDAMGGSPTPPPMAVSYYDTISPPEEPVREGGVFRGWYTDPEYNNLYDFSRPITGPLKLYAKWDIPVFTVYFQNQNIGTKPPVQRIEYGETAVRPEDPSAPGYIFGGWYIDGAEYDFSAPVKRNLTLWAKWTKHCTITFDSGGGSGSMASEMALQRTSFTAPGCGFTPPEGKQFKYWAVTGEPGYKAPGQTVVIEDDTTFTAVWENVATRLITFNMNGHGEAIAPMRVQWKTAPMTPPEEPYESGWTFKGWYTTKAGADGASSSYLFDFTKPLYDNVTLYAGWRDSTAYVIHMSYEGTGFGHATLTGDELVQLNDETYLAHPGTVISVATAPAEGSVNDTAYGSGWIMADSSYIGGTQRFTMQRKDMYVTVRFAMKPLAEGGHLHDAATLVFRPERAATCTADGCMEHYECPICGEWFSYNDYWGRYDPVFSIEYYTVRAQGHVPGDPVRENEEAPTCTEDGFCDLVTYCTVCHAEVDREFTALDATGHDWSAVDYRWATTFGSVLASRVCGNDPSHVESERATLDRAERAAATCETAGYIRYVSKAFANPAFDVQTLYIEGDPALGHDWDEGVVVTAPGCETDGQRRLTCTRCGETMMTPIPALGHIWTISYSWSSNHASCTADAVCARSRSHDFTANGVVTRETRIPASCDQEGLAVWTAVFDDPVLETQMAAGPIPALTHTPDEAHEENRVEPTCTSSGYYELVTRCEHCGKVLNSVPTSVPALGHSWGAWTVVSAATETAEGSEKRTCARCGETETRAIPKLSHVHVLVKTEAAAPTCTAAGHIAYWTCSGCGRLFRDAAGTTEIDAAAAVTPALGHAYTETVTPPTCTEKGYTTHTCSRCGDTYRDAETAALGHSWGAWTEVTPATVHAEGSEKRMCARCGQTEFRAIPKLPDPTIRVSGDEGDDAVDYTVTNAPAGAVLIAARYEGGRMTSVKVLPADASGTADLPGTGDEYRLFLVTGDYIPLCAAWEDR